MNKFKGIIFDLDGTLLNTIEDLADALNRALDFYGMPSHGYKECCYFVGNGARTMIKRAMPQEKRADNALVDNVLKMFSEDYAKSCDNKTRVYPGINNLLQNLSDEFSQLKLAVLSNKPDRYMPMIKEKFFAETAFLPFRGKCEGIAAKPDPAGALQIATEIGEIPEEIIYVGDSSVDMDTAVSAGMYPCGVLWGYRDEDELLASGAKFIAKKAEDILQLLS